MYKELFSLKNKVAIVTGALGLLGKEHCTALSDAGASVIVCDLNKKKCEQFASELGSQHYGVSADITDINSVIHLKDKILKRYGTVDILVNNAAINDMFESPALASELSKFENYPVKMFKQSLDVNVTGTFICSQVFGTVMAEKKKGSIINIASTYGIVAPDQSLYRDENGHQSFYKSAAYPVSKGAVISFTKFLASYWGEQGVRVNSLSPGGVENGQTHFFVANYSKKTPLNRMAKPDDYRGAVVFLASDASLYMTGANLVVDGGFTCW